MAYLPQIPVTASDFNSVDTTLQNYYKLDESSGTTANDHGFGTHRKRHV